MEESFGSEKAVSMIMSDAWDYPVNYKAKGKKTYEQCVYVSPILNLPAQALGRIV
jgi:hypothetical protein